MTWRPLPNRLPGIIRAQRDAEQIIIDVEQVRRAVATGELTAWTPTLRAGTSNPVLGTGGDVSGQYQVTDGWLTGWVRWRFGTSGVSSGTGSYFFDAPATPHASLVVSDTSGEATIVGYGWARDNSAAADSVGLVVQVTSSGLQMVTVDTNPFLSHNHPWTWAANDRITLQLSYPVAQT